MSFYLRAMEPQDLDPLLLLALHSEGAPRWSYSDYERILSAKPGDPLQRCGLVAVRGGDLAGFATIAWLRQETAAEVESLFVQSTCRRQGVGGALVGACIRWAANAGALTIRLEVRASNAAALALYRRHGFAHVGVRRVYYSNPVEDALLLEAPLPL